MIKTKDSKQVIEILKKGGVGVLPTDTVYGLVGRAEDKKAVERIYKLKKRNKSKPFIILISDLSDLKKFEVSPSKEIISFLKKIWPGRISIILPLQSLRFSYLHRGKKSLAFRIPASIFLRKVISKTGPLVAPSANFEGEPPAVSIEEAEEYFGDRVDFYFDKGEQDKPPSIILELKRG